MSTKSVSPGQSLAGIAGGAKKTPEGCIGLVSDDKAWEEAARLTFDDSQPVILIGDITQLYDYVTRIPELAWDLMEFAEKPLVLVMAEGKNLPEHFLGRDGEIRISLVKEPALLRHIRQYRQGFFYLPVDAKNITGGAESEILSPIQNVIILQQEFLKSSLAKTARLDMDGTIKFL